MKSIAHLTKRNKKMKCLGPAPALEAKDYEALAVGRKLECIRALIPLGLMHLQERWTKRGVR